MEAKGANLFEGLTDDNTIECATYIYEAIRPK